MASVKRNQYEAAFKAWVALGAVKGEKPVAQIASKYGLHHNQVRQWKEHLLDVLPGIFLDRRKKTDEESEQIEVEFSKELH